MGKEIYLWRDDLTGFVESGNKIRKLEFLVADALAKGCDTLITCGGPQSNHTRSTAAVARELGMEVSILILPKPGFDRSADPTANLLLDEIFGAKLVWLDFDEFQKRGQGYAPYLTQEAEALKAQGKKPYVIPLGGSNPVGCLGYQAAVEEMLPIWKDAAKTAAPDDLFCTLGTGGTFMGLRLGIEKQKLSTHLHGVNVIGPMSVTEGYVTQLTRDLEAKGVAFSPEGKFEMIDGYVGGGYAVASDDDLAFYSQFAREEGVLLDPCYTGKAFQGMIAEIRKNPSRFGNQILFLHSGGGFGTFAYTSQYRRVLLKRSV